MFYALWLLLLSSLASCLGFYLVKLAYSLWLSAAIKHKICEIKILQFDAVQEGQQWWRLSKDMLFIVDGRLYRVRKGFCWNGASTGIFKAIIKPKDHLRDSAPHDLTYLLHKIEVWDPVKKTWVFIKVGKRLADAWYLSLSKDCDNDSLTLADTMFIVLHIAGHKAYHTKSCNNNCVLCPAGYGNWCPYNPENWRESDV